MFVVQQRTAFVAERRIADLGRAAAHQHDRPVARLLKSAQLHDLYHAADMQAGCGAVETDITRQNALVGAGIERFQIGALMQEAAPDDFANKLGHGLGHDVTFRMRMKPSAWTRACPVA